MKQLHIFSLIFSLIITVTATAQVNKGAIFLGGSFGGSSYKGTYDPGDLNRKQTGLTISPAFGIAIKDNIIVGINTAYSHGKTKQATTPASSESNHYHAGVFVRKYKAIGKGGFSFFIQGDMGWTQNKLENINGFDRSVGTTTSLGINAYPGISFAVSKRFQLESGFGGLLSAGIGKDKITYYSGNTVVATDKGNGFNVSTSLNNPSSALFVGFRVLLNKS